MGNKFSTKVNNEQILKETSEYPVVMYTKPNCGYCKMAKQLLDQEKILFKENDLDLIAATNPEAYQPYINGLVYTTRQTTVPQIFVCGRFIGGYTELYNLREAKKLFESLDECAYQYDPLI
uniref:Glutaredoxin domain-containing protein n=1 Tax=Panagrolaimus sp. JU765 TaxID=591449 RepID=A0AC34RIW3_9BILA